MNADNRLFVWVDDKPLIFGGLPYQDYERTDPVVPKFSETDPGDALPLGIGCQTAQVDISRLKVWRDVYYTSNPCRTFPRLELDYRVNVDLPSLSSILDDPTKWNSADGVELFASLKRAENDLRQLGDEQYFPMGDNSPASADARVWGEPAYVKRDLLLGRGLFLYWPHSLNRPIYGLPDFARMKFIR